IAALGAVVPVVVGIGTGDPPSVLQFIGMVGALAGAIMASREPAEEGRPGAKLAAGAVLAAASALFWGCFFLTMDVASDGGAVWASFGTRATSLVPLGGGA